MRYPGPVRCRRPHGSISGEHDDLSSCPQGSILVEHQGSILMSLNVPTTLALGLLFPGREKGRGDQGRGMGAGRSHQRERPQISAVLMPVYVKLSV